MGEFGYRPTHVKLFDGKLTLDPEIVEMMGEIEAQMNARRIIAEMMNPNWHLSLPTFQSMLLSPPNIFATPLPNPGMPIPRGAGPALPRAGELSDIASAVYKIPAVQGLLARAHDEGLSQVRLLRREWDTASNPNRVAMISMATVFTGALIAPIIANQQTRDMAFGLIKGRDIPVPGISGLSFQILDSGGALNAPLGIPGLSGKARLQLPNSAAPSYEATITFDVMEFVRSRSSTRP